MKPANFVKAFSVVVFSASILMGCQKGSEVIEINFPTSWVGVSPTAKYFQERKAAFEKKYEGKYKLVVEEIPGDQAYVDKLKVLYSSKSLPDVISTGGYNIIDMMKDQLVDLTPYIDKDTEWKAQISDVGYAANSRDGKLYGIPYMRQVIGYFYNKELFAKAGIEEPAKTWNEFFAQCEKLKAVGIVPISMDTADSGWLSSLLLGAMVAESDSGEKFMNTLLPKNYETPELLDATKKIQKLFSSYTTADAIGGKYENGAANFFSGKTAIIANGPWMVADFYNESLVGSGFYDKIATAIYPGDVMYNSGKTGFHIAAKTPEKIEAALAFVKFMTSKESQERIIELSGETPDIISVTSPKVKPLVTSILKNSTIAKRKINDFQSLWYANVVDEISIQYPLLAQRKITPEQFLKSLTDSAKKN